MKYNDNNGLGGDVVGVVVVGFKTVTPNFDTLKFSELLREILAITIECGTLSDRDRPEWAVFEGIETYRFQFFRKTKENKFRAVLKRTLANVCE